MRVNLQGVANKENLKSNNLICKIYKKFSATITNWLQQKERKLYSMRRAANCLCLCIKQALNDDNTQIMKEIKLAEREISSFEREILISLQSGNQ